MTTMYSTIRKGHMKYVFHGTDKKSLLTTMRKWESENGVSVKRHEYREGTYNNSYWNTLWTKVKLWGMTLRELFEKDMIVPWLTVLTIIFFSPVLGTPIMSLRGNGLKLLKSFMNMGHSFVTSWLICVGLVGGTLFGIVFLYFLYKLYLGIKETNYTLEHTVVVC